MNPIKELIQQLENQEGSTSKEQGRWSIDEEKRQYFDLQNVELSEEGMKHYSNFVRKVMEEQTKRDVIKLLKRLARQIEKGRRLAKISFRKEERRAAMVAKLRAMGKQFGIKIGYGNLICPYRLHVEVK